MGSYSFSSLADGALLGDMPAFLARERGAKAIVLARLAEIDARRLYLPAGYPSMYAYCVDALHLSEQSAKKRIRAGRAARRFPVIFEAIADGRLHLSAVVMLASYLSSENAAELLASAAHKTESQIDELIAAWFPRLDVPAAIDPIPPTPECVQVSLRTPETGPTDEPLALQATGAGRPDPDPVEATALKRPSAPAETPRPRVTPLAPGRWAVQFTLGQRHHDLLCYVQALLGHQVPSGDIAQVFRRSLEALAEKLEKRKFAATDRPRRPSRPTTSRRHIPAHIRRAVRERDGGRCTFTSDTGHRCGVRTPLEYDHIEPVARGGSATVEGIRLRCRAHNQYEAERAFGAEFMKHKREEARRAAAKARAEADALAEARRAEAAAQAEAKARAEAAAAEAKARAEEVIPWLRQLGFRADESRHAAALCEAIPDASLEDRVRRALSYFSARVPSRTRAPSPGNAPSMEMGTAA